jgi:hypothetical protein
LTALLAFPHVSDASIWDIIWSMSGPQMVGVVFHCEYDVQGVDPTKDTIECRALDKLVMFETAPRRLRRIWLTLDANLYTSTGRNSESNEFEAFKNFMIAFEPLVEVRSFTSDRGNGNLSFHHGLGGLSYDFLFGSDYQAFDKAGFKFRPIGLTYKKFNASYTLRVYPNGFTPDEFGIGARVDDLNREAEVVQGFTIGFLW